MPDEDRTSDNDCRTTTEGEEFDPTVGSGTPVSEGWKRIHHSSVTKCDIYHPWNPSGGRVHWASEWRSANGTQGTTGTRKVGLNLPVKVSSSESRPVVWDLRTGQHIDVD